MAIVESNRWASKNAPAFVEEPYLNCVENYITKCEFEVYEIDIPGSGNSYGSQNQGLHKSYTTNWETLNDHLKAHDHFGGAMGFGLYLNSVAKEIRHNSKTDDEKIKKAHDFIKQMKWNGDESIYISKTNLGEVYNEKIGNCADINLMLVMLLRKLDFDANPLILSTADNGILSKSFPSLERLNYVLANIKFSDSRYLNLDATESLLPYHILPKRCLNGFGVIVKSGKPEFVDLIPIKSNQISKLYSLELNDDLTFKGKINSSRIDYAAFNFRKKYFDFNSDEEFISDKKNHVKV